MAKKIALLSNITMEFLAENISNNLKERKIDANLWLAGYGQYKNEILDDKSSLYQYDPDYIIIYLDGTMLFSNEYYDLLNEEGDAVKLAKTAFNDSYNLVKKLNMKLPKSYVLINTIIGETASMFSGLESNYAYGINTIINYFNKFLVHAKKGNSKMIIYDVDYIAKVIGHNNWFDYRFWYLAKSNFSNLALKECSSLICSVIQSLEGKNKKAIILDLDNTLWGGIIGEDGFNGIKLGPEGIGQAYMEFQKILKLLTKQGVILGICSKNNYEDAINVIRKHPYMILREEDFAAIKINWQDKPTNINEIALDLNIGLDSLVFIDDNPFEREYVRRSLPQVIVPDWPADPSFYKAALIKLYDRYFYKLNITSEDKERLNLYQAQIKRKILMESFSSLEEFLESLEMQCFIRINDKTNIARMAQLTQRTNQFNLTTRRYTEADIENFLNSNNYLLFTIQLIDKFGDNGTVGLSIIELKNDKSARIDIFLLSCRVIGRKVENAFMSIIIDKLKEFGISRLIGEYIPTNKNKIVANFYSDLGFEKIKEDNDGISYWEYKLKDNKIEMPSFFKISAEEEGLYDR